MISEPDASQRYSQKTFSLCLFPNTKGLYGEFYTTVDHVAKTTANHIFEVFLEAERIGQPVAYS